MNAFSWQRPYGDVKGKPLAPFRKPSLKPRRYHEHTAAKVSDATREALIAQVNTELEYHFALAQKVTDDVMRGMHRDEARRLAMKVRDLQKAAA